MRLTVVVAFCQRLQRLATWGGVRPQEKPRRGFRTTDGAGLGLQS
jgi:hypothetical protein